MIRAAWDAGKPFLVASLALGLSSPAYNATPAFGSSPEGYKQAARSSETAPHRQSEQADSRASETDGASAGSAQATQTADTREPVDKSGTDTAEAPAPGAAASPDVKDFAGVKEAVAVRHYSLSNFYFHKVWDLKLAEVELDQAIMYWPTLKIAHRDLCLVSLLQGNVARALAELMMVVGLGNPIPYNEDERAELSRRAYKLHFERGLAEGRKGHWQDAAAEFQWALTYDPESSTASRWLAFSYASLGDFKKAEDAYERTFELAPDDAFAHADFAFMLASRGKQDRAIEEMSEAIQRSPTAAALHVDLGLMAENKGDLPTASEEFRKAVELAPHHAWLWARLGQLLERQGEAAEAIQAYNKAVALDPKQSEALERLTQLKAQKPS